MSYRDKQKTAIKLVRFADFWGTWQQYKAYLREQGYLSEALEVGNTPITQPGKVLSGVSWAGKVYKDYTNDDKRGLWSHLKEMDTVERKKYEAYLVHWCGFPKGVFNGA